MRGQKCTDVQKMEIALHILSGKLSYGEVCRKYGISSTYAYKLKDRAMEILMQGMICPSGKQSTEIEVLQKRIADLKQISGDQALAMETFEDGSARKNEDLLAA